MPNNQVPFRYTSYKTTKPKVEEPKIYKEGILEELNYINEKIYYIDKSEVVKYDTARISGLKTSKLVSKLFKENDNVFMNCNFNNKFNNILTFTS